MRAGARGERGRNLAPPPLERRSPAPRTGTSPSRPSAARTSDRPSTACRTPTEAPDYTVPGETTPQLHATHGGQRRLHAVRVAGDDTLRSSNEREQSRSHGNYAIYEAPYPPTVSGSAGSQTDNVYPDHDPRIERATTTCRPYQQMEAKWLSSDAMPARPRAPCTCRVPLSAERRRLVTTSVPLMQPNSGQRRGQPSRDRPRRQDAGDLRRHRRSHAPGQSQRRQHSPSATSLPSPASRSGQVDEYPDWNGAGTQHHLRSLAHHLHVLNSTEGHGNSL